LATLAGNFRNQVKAKFSHIEDRRYFWEKAFSGVVAEKVFAGKMTTGLRSTIDGITKLHKSGESTTLTGILAFFANSDTLIYELFSYFY
jgi:uroporphyrin-III C-methyltransferase/precorrin-2 dehydrogenase/sirohydrochlorin ferrochelatase